MRSFQTKALSVTYCIHVSSSGDRKSSFFITDAG